MQLDKQTPKLAKEIIKIRSKKNETEMKETIVIVL